MSESCAATTRRLVLLGGWDLVVDGESVRLGGREQRLSALLALTGHRARSQVAGILWPESTDARALASLRRAVLQTQRRSPGLLRADRTSIGLHPDVLVDVDELRDATARVGEVEPDPGVLAVLAGGELLPDWYDDWVEPERERIQQQRVRALEQLARRALGCGDPALAVDAAHAAAGVEPLLESASELAIRGHLARGDRASAVRELERYCDLVDDELGESPSPALVALLAPPRPVASPPPDVPRPRPSAEARDEARDEDRDEDRDEARDEARDEPRDEPARPEVASAAPPLPPLPARPSEPAASVAEEPAGLTFGGAAARLLVAAGLVLAVSLGVAGLGAGRTGGPVGPDATEGLRRVAPSATGPEDARAASGEPPGGVLKTRVQKVRVRPVVGADGAAAFVVRAALRPARVRLEVAGPAGLDVVRNVMVRSAGGQRLVLGALDPGTYRWSATSSSAEMVTGKVRVVEEPTVLAVAESSEPKPEPKVNPVAAQTEAPPPSPTPSPTPTATPSSTPSSTPSPAPTPSPTPTPSQTRSSTSQPTDPGTTDPGPVG